MAGSVRQIIEVPCTVEALERSEALSQLAPEALTALGAESIDGDRPSPRRRRPAWTLHLRRAWRPTTLGAGTSCSTPPSASLPPEYSEPAIKLVGTMMMFHGQSVYERLRRAAHCALMAVTIGPDNPAALPADADELDRALADACARALVESAADHVNAAIVAAAMEEGLYTDDRLSPGMGDFPLDTRLQFVFYTQSEKRLGLKLGKDGVFEPRYSTVGVIGLYDPSHKGRKRACGRCKYRSYCSIRAIGMTCHGGKGSFK